MYAKESGVEMKISVNTMLVNESEVEMKVSVNICMSRSLKWK